MLFSKNMAETNIRRGSGAPSKHAVNDVRLSMRCWYSETPRSRYQNHRLFFLLSSTNNLVQTVRGSLSHCWHRLDAAIFYINCERVGCVDAFDWKALAASLCLWTCARSQLPFLENCFVHSWNELNAKALLSVISKKLCHGMQPKDEYGSYRGYSFKILKNTIRFGSSQDFKRTHLGS